MQQYRKTKRIRYQNPKNNFKPALIGTALIILVIGLYLSKTFLFNKKDTETKELNIEKSEEKKEEEVSVPMILPEDVLGLINEENHQLIDIRNSSEFKASHIENSKNIPIKKIREKIKEIDKNKPITIIDKEDSLKGKSITNDLNRLGFSAKYLAGGITAFSAEKYSVISFGDPNSPTDIIKVIPLSNEEVYEKISKDFDITKFLDVRPKSKFQEFQIEGSINIPLEELEKRKKELPKKKLIIVDEDPIRSFQAAVRLHDMNFSGVYCLKTSLSDFRKYVDEISNPEKPNPSTD